MRFDLVSLPHSIIGKTNRKDAETQSYIGRATPAAHEGILG